MPQMQDRKFGQQMSIALFVIGAIGLLRNWNQAVTYTLLVLAAVHLVLAYLAPIALGPINRFWMGIGFVLGKIVQPIVLSVLFLVLFTPIALVMRIAGRDALYLRNREGESFWIPRGIQKIESESFRNQF